MDKITRRNAIFGAIMATIVVPFVKKGEAVGPSPQFMEGPPTFTMDTSTTIEEAINNRVDMIIKSYTTDPWVGTMKKVCVNLENKALVEKMINTVKPTAEMFPVTFGDGSIPAFRVRNLVIVGSLNRNGLEGYVL